MPLLTYLYEKQLSSVIQTRIMVGAKPVYTIGYVCDLQQLHNFSNVWVFHIQTDENTGHFEIILK